MEFGILTLVWGALDMSRSVLHLDYRPPVFAILLTLAGLLILAGAILNTKKAPLL